MTNERRDAEGAMTVEEIVERVVKLFEKHNVYNVAIGINLQRDLEAFGVQRFEEGRDVGNETLKVNFKHWTDLARREGYREALEQAAKERDALKAKCEELDAYYGAAQDAYERNFVELRKLTVRLEAAEACISLCCTCKDDCECGNFERVQAWRKAAGKDSAGSEGK